MFKSFQNTSRSHGFNGFPALNFQMNNEAYGFSGCTFWLDAAYGLNTQTDLAAVSSWQSRIGGITFTQATAGNQPRYILSSPSYNNLPVIEAQDGNRRMNANFGLNYLKASWTLAWVANTRIIGGASAAILGNSSNANYYYALTRPESSSSGIALYDGATVVLNSTVRDINPHIVVFTGTEVVVDGVQKATISELSNFQELNQLFAYQSANGTGLNGYCAEILWYNKKLSSTDCINLSSRLNSKYAIY